MGNLKSIFVDPKSGSESIGKTLKNMNASLKSMPSILSKDSTVEGKIKNSGVLEIEGKVKGTITGSYVVIRDSGFVDGQINVESVSIHGKFNGDIKAKNVSIFKKAKIIGNIEYQSLSVEDGACIEGQFKQIVASEDSKVANNNNDLKKVV